MEVGGSQLPAPKSGYGTPGHRLNSTRLTPTGLSPSLAGLSRPLRLRRGGGSRAHNSTSPTGFPAGFSLDSSPFARRYSGNPCWFLFLPLLRCFRSGGSRSPIGSIPKAHVGLRDRRSHSGILGSTATCAYPRLIAACHALLRRPSRAIHQTAWHVGPTRNQRLFDVEPIHGDHRENEVILTFTLPSPSSLMGKCIYPAKFINISFGYKFYSSLHITFVDSGYELEDREALGCVAWRIHITDAGG